MTTRRPHRLRAPHDHLDPHAARRRVAECLAGRMPAEALPTRDRARLVGQLVLGGWTDVEIAARLQQSTYTTARIRAGLALAPNTAHRRRRTAG